MIFFFFEFLRNYKKIQVHVYFNIIFMFYFIFKGKQKCLNYFHLNAYKKQKKKITKYILIFIMCVQVEGFYFFLKNSFKSSKKNV